MEKISSKDNKNYQLIKSLEQKKYRDKTGLFLIEGKKLVKEAIKSKQEIEYLIFQESKNIDDDFSGLDSKRLVLVDKLFLALTDQKKPEGILAVIRKNDFLKSPSSNKILCLDSISDPGNMGTIIRSAEAFGFSEIILTGTCVDIFSPKVLRASMGSFFRTEFIKMNYEQLSSLKDDGYKIISTELYNSKDLKSTEIKGKLIVVIGSESHGVSKEISHLADIKVRIEMKGQIESLNAGIAASLIMFYLSDI